LATQELFALLKRHDPSIRALSHLGELLIQEKREEEALEAYEAARRLNPDDLEILSELSYIYDEKGMYGLAEESSRHALALGANHELSHILARALYGQGRFEEAAVWFERVIAEDPDNLAALRAIVDIYQRMERPDLELGHRQRLAAVEESTREMLLAEAIKKRRDLDFEGAAEAYRKVHESRLSDMETLWDLVIVLLADGRNERAASMLREMVTIDPEHGVAHLTLGVLCAQKLECEAEEARQHLETFLEVAPDDINADLARRELTTLTRRR
jgi:tetratricopeptide (TPR) repeat protein